MRALLPMALLCAAAAPARSASPVPAPGPVARAARAWLASSEAAWAASLSAPDRDDWERDDWDWVDRRPAGARAGGRKSLLKAVAASALLPGLGERYVGRGGRASFFHAAEGLIWTTFAGYRIQGDLRRDRYVEFAEVRAGASPDGDSDYYEHIGLWLSLEEWHEIVRRDARLRFPDDPTAQQEFFERNKRYGEGEAWAWPDDATRLRYRQLRSRSERSYRNARLAVGAAIVNRLASMIDALALARAHNRGVREEARVAVRIGPLATAGGLGIGPVLSARY